MEAVQGVKGGLRGGLAPRGSTRHSPRVPAVLARAAQAGLRAGRLPPSDIASQQWPSTNTCELPLASYKRTADYLTKATSESALDMCNKELEVGRHCNSAA